MASIISLPYRTARPVPITCYRSRSCIHLRRMPATRHTAWCYIRWFGRCVCSKEIRSRSASTPWCLLSSKSALTQRLLSRMPCTLTHRMLSNRSLRGGIDIILCCEGAQLRITTLDAFIAWRAPVTFHFPRPTGVAARPASLLLLAKESSRFCIRTAN